MTSASARMSAYDRLPRAVRSWLDSDALHGWDPRPMVRQWDWARTHGWTEGDFLAELKAAERREVEKWRKGKKE